MTSSALVLPPQRNEIPPPKNRPILVLNFNFNNCTSTFSRYSPGFFPWHLFFFPFVFLFFFFPGCEVLIYRHYHVSLRHKAVEIHHRILDILGACAWDRVGVVSSCTMGLFCVCYQFIKLHRKLDPNWCSETVPRCNSTQHQTVFTRLHLNIVHFSGLKIFTKF